MKKRKVIIVTDGDEVARKTLEMVANEIGGSCISQSSGNPTKLTGEELTSHIIKAKNDPVLVMFDDCGYREEGIGETAMKYVANHKSIDVIGSLAVASSTRTSEWAHVDVSIDRYGKLTEYGVDKEGLKDLEIGRIYGDTVYILDELSIPIVVGIGDIGKMVGQDAIKRGSPVTKQAIELILERSGYHESKE